MTQPTALTIEYLAPQLLKPNERNPRIHNKKQLNQLISSIRRFGFVTPVLVDDERRLIAGHGRVLAATELGLDEVPTISVSHLTEAEKRAYMIADNKLTENAQWDDAILAEHFEALDALDFDLELTGFSVPEIDLCIGSSHEQEAADEDVLIEGCPPVCLPGDLWQLDEHVLLCSDSLKLESYERLLTEHKAQMVFTDPPYNVPVTGHVCGNGGIRHREFTMAAGEMSQDEFTQFLLQICKHLTKFSLDGSLHYICMDWRHMRELLDAGAESYHELKNLCVWVKDNGGMGSLYRSQHELIAVFKHGTRAHRNNIELGQYGRYRTNVWHYAGINSFARIHQGEGNLLALHPTVKPMAMVADAILDCTKRNEIVLDVFLGSGSTLIAAEKMGRRCYGIEIDPLYVDVAIRRWQQWTGQHAVHVESGRAFDEISVQKETV